MKSGDCRLNVDAIKNQTGPIEPVEQEKVTPEIQASTNHDPTNKFTSFEDFRQVTYMQLLDELEAQNYQHVKDQKQTKIQRVPEVLQRNEEFKDYFKPMQLSVGPLHCDDPKLFKAELKLKLAARFIKDSGCRAESLFTECKNNLCNLRTSFDEGEIKLYSDEILARLFFLDGRTILQFIDSCINRSLNEFNINNGLAELVRQDLFLFENQIPFQVLVLLMNMKDQKRTGTVKEEGNMKHYLVRFLLANNLIEPVDTMRSVPAKHLLDLINRPEGKLAHLLDLLRTALIIDPLGNRVDNNKNLLEPFCNCLSTFCCEWCRLPHWLLDILLTFAIYILSFFVYNWNQQQSFRNVQELKAAGITMKPSDSCSLRDICFRSGWCFRARVELSWLSLALWLCFC